MPGHYLALTPDINAARIEGPGEASVITAGSAMTTLGAAVGAAAGTVTASVATLASAGWTGASGVTTAASFFPHVGWMTAQAATLAAIGAKHVAFAEAYRTANLLIPKVPVVAENQIEHGVLQATNIFGINGLPIAINRGIYQGYWVAAGTAMNTYEAVGATQSVPIPSTMPPPITTLGISMLSAGATTGASAAASAAQSSMGAAATAMSAVTGTGSAAAGSAVQAMSAASGTGANSGPIGANGQAQAGAPATTGKANPVNSQMTSLLSQAPQALSQLPQAAGQLPQAATQAVSGPGQALMGPLQGLMTGGSGGGVPANGLGGMSGMYPGSALANAGERSTPSSAGLTRSAGIGGGGGGGFATPSGWRSTADTMGINAAAAAGTGAGRPVAGGADVRGGMDGRGMGPMMGPMGSAMSGNHGRGMRNGAPLSWEEDPFGAEEDNDLPMVLSAASERGA